MSLEDIRHNGCLIVLVSAIHLPLTRCEGHRLPYARRFNFVLYENEFSSRTYACSGDVAVALKDTLEVTEQAAHNFIGDYLSNEFDPAVETELIGVSVHEVQEVVDLYLTCR